MNMKLEIKEFYERFVTTTYGFTLVFGFSRFIEIRRAHAATFSVYVLLATAYVLILHFWIIFFAATNETFRLLLSEEHSKSIRMIWFWIELIFATLFSIFILMMFSQLDDILSFTASMTITAFWSLLWDLWAFWVSSYLRSRNIKQAQSVMRSTKDLLMNWIGLDILFFLGMALLFLTLKSHKGTVNELLISLALLSIAIFGAILDTILFNPDLYLKKR